jgi:hypothetical protein
MYRLGLPIAGGEHLSEFNILKKNKPSTPHLIICGGNLSQFYNYVFDSRNFGCFLDSYFCIKYQNDGKYRKQGNSNYRCQ